MHEINGLPYCFNLKLTKRLPPKELSRNQPIKFKYQSTHLATVGIYNLGELKNIRNQFIYK